MLCHQACHTKLLYLQDIARRLRVARPAITVYNFDTAPHDLSRRPQLPADVLTIKQVLCLPEDPKISRVLHNYLLDYEQIERRVLVPVRPFSEEEEEEAITSFQPSRAD